MIKYIFLFAVLYMFNSTCQAEDSLNVRAKAVDNGIYIEYLIFIPKLKNNQAYKYFGVLLNIDNSLAVYVESHGKDDGENVVHTLRVNENQLNNIIIIISYGDGILCDSLTYRYRLSEIVLEEIKGS